MAPNPTKPLLVSLKSISARVFGLLFPLKDNDRLSRAVFDKINLTAKQPIKANAFLPRDKNTDVVRAEISLQRTTDLAEQATWLIIKKYVEDVSGRIAKGRADLLLTNMSNLSLEIKVQPEPYLWDWRHTAVVYPLADYNQIKEMALEIAKISKPNVKP